MQEWLEFVVKGLVEHADDVSITAVDRHGSTHYEVRLHPDDVGRVVGRQGSTIHALRALLVVGGAKQGLRCSLDIVEDSRGTRDGAD